MKAPQSHTSLMSPEVAVGAVVVFDGRLFRVVERTECRPNRWGNVADLVLVSDKGRQKKRYYGGVRANGESFIVG